MNTEGKQQIKILKDGPYLVTGSVPLREKVMVSAGHHREYQDGREFAHEESYALCRCGQSSNPPFCDATHAKVGFTGLEVADKTPYDERADVFEGPTLDLYDDNRCAFARFCHQEHGDVWTLTESSHHAVLREEAITASINCPTGRLVQHDKEKGYAEIEPEVDPSVWILQDPERDVSGPLFVRGGIELVGSDGTAYELRNRYALCRCGSSQNKPFCDAMHVSVDYQDGLNQI